jgi:hypothetical protein
MSEQQPSQPPGPTPGDVGALLRRGAKSALARWVLHKQRQRRDPQAVAWPTPQDEATHEWDGRRHFAEDYTFAAVQPGLAVVTRLEWLPGRASHRVWMTILRPDGAYCLPGGQLVRRDADGDRWRAGGMVIDCRTPLRRWTVRYSGRLQAVGSGRVASSDQPATGPRCALDLTFDATGDAFGPGRDDAPDLLAARLAEATWDAKLLASVRRVQNRGYVQLGRMEGSISLGTEIIPLRATGWRQHSWGVLDWGASDEAFQCFWTEPSGAATWVHRARFPFVTLEGGFVDRRGGRQLVRGIAATFERRPERAPARASVGLQTDAEVDHEFQIVNDLAFVVDGRGLVELGLMTTAQGGVGIWGGQRRALPRRG